MPSLLGMTLVVFLLGALTPGDPAVEVHLQRYGELPTDAGVLIALRTELGLDQPLPLRYLHWLWHLCQGDLGTSWRHAQPVAALLSRAVGHTLVLTGAGALVAVGLGVVIGLSSALWQGSVIDRFLSALVVMTSGIPAFLIAYALMYLFAVRWRLLPALGTGDLRHVLLPGLTLGLASFQSLARVVRAATADALQSPWLWTARAKGLRERVVVLRHGVRTCVPLLLTAAANTVTTAVGRAVLVEVVFGWPGLGRLIADSVVFRDLPAIQGFALLFGAMIILLYLAVDILAARFDPRVRQALTEGRPA
ncbi:MAG: ABC transporter permease [Anaerolineae bacterium]